ncbi:MAG TPA: hypothetical protein VE978_02165, partial [Chitinophagales bacterium]|nr:hypothetical protein [Chitinophagales bacterium]
MKKIFGIWVCIFFSVVAHTKANDSLQHKYHSWCFSFLAAPDLIGNAGKELEVSVRNGDRNSPLGLYFQADRGFKKYFSAGV